MIWIGFLVMIAAVIGCASLLRSKRGDALGMPLVAVGVFVFLYILQPFQLVRTGTLELFLSDWQVTKALLIPALMLVSFVWGWLYVRTARPVSGAPWDPRHLWGPGLAAACMGTILYIIFLERSGGILQSFSQAHGRAMEFAKNTAYLYDGPWLMLSGAVMMIYGSQDTMTPRWKVILPYCFLGAFLINAILGGDRGPLFAVLSATFIATSIARQKQVKLRQAAALLFVLGCVVVVIFANRERVHLGDENVNTAQSTADAINGLVGTTEYDQEHGTAAQEFLYHAATIETVDQTGKLDWGVNWIEFFLINPIPRILWPEKPNPDWLGVTAGDIYQHTSIVISPGAAQGIVGDLYARFHLLSALFLWGLGFGLRRLFMLARSFSSPLTTVGYVMVYALSLNMFAQGFSAIFVPLLYSMAPVLLFTLVLRIQRRRTMQRRRVFLHELAQRGEQWSS